MNYTDKTVKKVEAYANAIIFRYTDDSYTLLLASSNAEILADEGFVLDIVDEPMKSIVTVQYDTEPKECVEITAGDDMLVGVSLYSTEGSINVYHLSSRKDLINGKFPIYNPSKDIIELTTTL